MKRIFDLIVAGGFLITLFIPMVMILILVRMTSIGPAFYWSKRIGKNNMIFKMPKFRTMRNDTPPVATHLLSGVEEVLTPIGGFLRRTSLDELPQFFSVLEGKMSIVGPRPPLQTEYESFSEFEKKKLSIKPGITCLWQVEGRNEISNR